VFLRALEYYRGLLFLTTNRVNTFDEAFKSRIHVSMHYKRLSRDQQSAIWKNCFARAKKDSVVITKKSTRYVSEDSDLLEREWNGREIQNGKYSFILNLSPSQRLNIAVLTKPFSFSFSNSFSFSAFRCRGRRHVKRKSKGSTSQTRCWNVHAFL